MAKKARRLLTVILAVVLVLSLLAGCGGKGREEAKKEPEKSAQTQQPATKDEDAKEASGPEEIKLPIVKEPITLTFFWRPDPKATMVLKSYEEMAFFQEMEKRTGVKMDFVHPPSDKTQEQQQFNLMLASDDLTDIVWFDWTKVPGGVAKLVEDGTIVRLNDYMDKYGPNMTKALEENPEWRKQMTLDDGSLYMYPKIKTDKTLLVTSSFQIRKDWLDRLGLKEPTTIDEWYNVLTAFKEKDANGNGDPNDEIPYAAHEKDISLGRFGIGFKTIYNEFYNDNNTVKYGPLEPEFKELVTTLNKWYKEGLIDPDYLSTDKTNFESKVVSNRVGSFYGMCNGHMGKFLGIWEKDHPDYSLVGVWPPIAPDGKKYVCSQQAEVSFDGAAITSKNKYVKETVKYMDYIHGEEGMLLMGYGIEGESYNMVNGKPVFTDDVLNNPDGLPVINALHKYTYSVSQGPGFQLKDVFSQVATYPSQNEAYERWTEDTVKLNITSLTPTEEEGKKLSKIMSDVDTYVAEMFNKFIMGQEPMSNYDKFVEKVKSMDIEEALKIQQAMLDRFNAKK